MRTALTIAVALSRSSGCSYLVDGARLELAASAVRTSPARAEGASTEHYALCRYGGSKNKPFCDGTHWYHKFRDDKN